MKVKTIVMVGLPGVQLLDISGPLDVFAEANVQAGETNYQLVLAAAESGPLRSSSGVKLVPDRTLSSHAWESIDTLLIAGCPNAAEIPATGPVVNWLRRYAPTARRFGSVCSGAFYLAAAGLLDGRRVTTHWAVAEELARQFPKVTVDADAIQVKDGKLRTAAGVTAGLDLALALVEEDLGREIAVRVSSQLVMYFRRSGGQLQFSRKGVVVPAGRSALQELQRWVTAHPALDHSVSQLARRMGVGPRHLGRIFRGEVGITPAKWVEDARITAVRQFLEQGNDALKKVAANCGFADVDTLRRAFRRNCGVTPTEYRKRFFGIG